MAESHLLAFFVAEVCEIVSIHLLEVFMRKILDKVFVVFGVFFLILPSFSLASPPVLVKKATLSGDFMPPRPEEPQTTFRLTVESCKKVNPQEWKSELKSSRRGV